MPNFSSLARLEVPEKFLWVGGVHSHFRVKPNRCVVLCWGWGFDNFGLSVNTAVVAMPFSNTMNSSHNNPGTVGAIYSQ